MLQTGTDSTDSDGEEAATGTNPLDPNDFPAPPISTLDRWGLALLMFGLAGTVRSLPLYCITEVREITRSSFGERRKRATGGATAAK